MKEIDLDKLKEQILEFLRIEMSDLWLGEEDTEFLELIAYDIATQQYLASVAESEKEYNEHKLNLLHLQTTIEGEVIRRKIKLNNKGKEMFGMILGIIIKTIVKAII